MVIDEDWEIMDRKRLGSIRLCVVSSITFNISKAKMIVELMETLAKLYEKPLDLNKVFLMKNLFNMKMGEGGSIVNHLKEFNIVNGQFSSIQISFDEEVRAL